VARKLTIKVGRRPAVVITRAALQHDRLVYLALTNHPFRYQYGRSRIAYIGTTKRGARRIAASAASKADQMLALHGVKELRFYVVSCRSRQGVRTWHRLERALLLTFREMHGEIPHCNRQGKRMKWRDELEYFTLKRLRAVLTKYERATD
jgi:hypothetical protein